MISFARALETDVPVLATIARQLCGNSFDADDLVQDTLERALRFGARYTEQGSRRSWLATILRNRFRDRYRSARARATATVEIDLIEAPEPTAPPTWEHLTEAQIDAAVALLPPPFRRVYELHACGHSYATIARELDIPPSTVGTRLVRARAKLKVILNAKATVC
jgi:RNA polymerase sigma-70 factor (ECF subfamily)